tara:strand:+ start:2525 stop:2854 length:330 start_codon:yes stop_codon:yes gene_type:complete
MAKPHQPHPLCAPALNGDALSGVFFPHRGAGDNAISRYNHKLLRLGYYLGGSYCTRFLDSPKGPYPTAGTVLAWIVVNGSEFAVAAISYYQQKGIGMSNINTDHLILSY